jgi:hypothetical protein
VTRDPHTHSVSYREEFKLRVFENRVLKGISGTKRDEIIGGWRKLRNEELRNLHPSQNIIRMMKSSRMRWAGHAAHLGEKRNALSFRRKARRKVTAIKFRSLWEDNNKMYLK